MAHARLLLAAILVLPRLVLACEPAPAAASPFDGLCGVLSGTCTRAPHVAVLSAFPTEQRMLRAAAAVTERVEIDGRPVLLGRLAGQPVALTLTGIGLVNAAAATEALVAHLDLSAIVFSGVAGSPFRIGDVIVPATWTDAASRSFAVDPGLLAEAETVAASAPALERCTPVPPNPPSAEVCLPHVPGVIVGGSGQSSDPFRGKSLPCQSGGGEIFGCDTEALATAREESAPVAIDEESAAVAAVASAHGVPFLIVRGVSDGAGDPLGLPGFPAQFFAYYRLAADNAATVVMRLLETLPTSGTSSGPVRAGPASACAFERAAAPACQGVSAPRRVGQLVSRACALRARAADMQADRLARSLPARGGTRQAPRAPFLLRRCPGRAPSCGGGSRLGREIDGYFTLGKPATMRRYSSSVKAREVSMRTLPFEPSASDSFTAVSSSGASASTTASYFPVTR